MQCFILDIAIKKHACKCIELTRLIGKSFSYKLFFPIGMEENPQSNEPSSESLSDSGMSQRVPKCARCRSHGINRELKGHKEKCQFKDCQCRSCLLVVERQKITATRVAHLRHQRKIDKQRNVGYYSAYAGLTEEEEFVLTRYVDGTEEKFKHRLPPSDYDYIDGKWSYHYSCYKVDAFDFHACKFIFSYDGV